MTAAVTPSGTSSVKVARKAVTSAAVSVAVREGTVSTAMAAVPSCDGATWVGANASPLVVVSPSRSACRAGSCDAISESAVNSAIAVELSSAGNSSRSATP